MAESSVCLGHGEQIARRNKIIKLSGSPLKSPDENLRVLIKKGPVSVETSLKELEENYARKPEWKLIEEGGVLNIPVEEFRMINPPKPDHAGNVEFGKKKAEGGGKLIENYPVGQTVENLNAQVLAKYNEVLDSAKNAGEPIDQTEKEAATETSFLSSRR